MKKNLVMGVVMVCVVGGLGLLASLVLSLFSPMKADGQTIHFTIRRGMNLNEASIMFSREGMVRNAFVFKTYMALRYPGLTVKAGSYALSAPLTPADLAAHIVAGNPRPEMNVTIIEGWTIRDILAHLSSKGFSVTEKDFELTAEMRSRYSFLKDLDGAGTLEGYLFPDTYQFYADASGKDIAAKMLDTFQKKVALELRDAAGNRGFNLDNAVILASIIEREVQTEEDRRMVADLFLRRLAIGMPLQADSTVNFITGKNTPSASAVDIRIESAYNTYRNKGLPPGPIGSPGLSAIKSVVVPLANPYWFFLTTPKGTVVYSKTFEEHVRNKGKYLR